MEAAAKHISRHGYSDMVLERVASDAGYTRGALYHFFANKAELTLAVIDWVNQTWHDEVGFLLAQRTDPVGTLVAVARGTAVYCRNDRARVLSRLLAEFHRVDHPVGRAAEEAAGHIVDEIIGVIKAGRRSGAIPPGPPPRMLAVAYLGSMEGVVSQLAGQDPFDAMFAERAALGVLGLPPTPEAGNPSSGNGRL